MNEQGMQLSGSGSKTQARGLLESLGSFSATLTLEAIPPEVVKQAKLSILDTVGCMVAGQAAAEARSFTEVELAGSRPGNASVLGASKKVDPQSAARVNGYLGDIFELNDLTGGHASIAVVPTALAMAETVGASGRALIEAVVAGIEVTSRVYAAYYPTMKSYEETGIAPPGIPSTIGSAAAAARLMGFDAARTTRTLEVAAAIAGWCPAEVIFGDGGTIKPILFGAWPASVAIQAVRYAEAGFDGPPRVLESRIGLYATLANAFDERAITAAGRWHLESPRRKRHACCGYIHSAIDAVLKLRSEGVDVKSADRIEVHLPAYVIPGVSKSGPPKTANEARFHAEYCIGLAAIGADLIAPAHSVELERFLPDVAPLMERIRVVDDVSLTHYHQCVVRGLDAAGLERFSTRLSAPRGAPGDPMSDDEVRQKFVVLCGASEPASYLAKIDSLESASTCAWVIGSFHPDTER